MDEDIQDKDFPKAKKPLNYSHKKNKKIRKFLLVSE